jgi:uncharacterized protein YjbJ (UPF0337 family)
MRAVTPVTDQRIGYAEGDSFIVIRYQEKSMNKDQSKGRVEEAKGKVKQATGKAVGNKELEQKGRIQKAGGKIQAGYGDLKENIKDST